MSNEASFTPGPWSPHATGLARSGKPEFEIHWSKAGECVAEIVHGEANASLIAAAPELYGALRAMLRLHELTDSPDGDVTIMAYAALSKARGES